MRRRRQPARPVRGRAFLPSAIMDRMDARQRESLDRYITGNYGNDQYQEDDDVREPDLTLPPIDPDIPDNHDNDERFVAELAALPMPRGMVLNYGPMTVRPAIHSYPETPLAEGECGECGTHAAVAAVMLEVKPDGAALIHQCKTCGADNILAVYHARRDNYTQKGA